MQSKFVQITTDSNKQIEGFELCNICWHWIPSCGFNREGGLTESTFLQYDDSDYMWESLCCWFCNILLEQWGSLWKKAMFLQFTRMKHNGLLYKAGVCVCIYTYSSQNGQQIGIGHYFTLTWIWLIVFAHFREWYHWFDMTEGCIIDQYPLHLVKTKHTHIQSLWPSSCL